MPFSESQMNARRRPRRELDPADDDAGVVDGAGGRRTAIESAQVQHAVGFVPEEGVPAGPRRQAHRSADDLSGVVDVQGAESAEVGGREELRIAFGVPRHAEILRGLPGVIACPTTMPRSLMP